MALHTCADCGLAHDAGTPAETPEPVEVTLARIEADRAIQVARIEAGARRAEADAIVDAAHEDARGEIGAAEAEAEIIGDAIEAAATPEEAAEIILPEPPEETVEETPGDAPPEVEGSPVPEPHRKSRGIGMW